MKIYDISQEVFHCEVFPGDQSPEKIEIFSMAKGDLYNLTAVQMCAHNGTHIDAPFHFVLQGKTVDQMALDAFIGLTYVAKHQGVLSEVDAKAIVQKAQQINPEAAKRILLKGQLEVSLEAAKVFAKNKLLLLGNESQTVGPIQAPLAVHLELLNAEVALLEGIVLSEVEEGVYFLNAAPLNLAGADGAPCRAVLIEINES